MGEPKFGEWTATADRLPAMDDDCRVQVLAAFDTGDVWPVYFSYRGGGKHIWRDGEGWDYNPPTHWMPMPPHPNETA